MILSVCLLSQADLCELLGLKDYMGVMYFITLVENVAPLSDQHVQVTEEKFDGVDVVLYQPKQHSDGTELRRAVIYLHGGGWCLGSSRKLMTWLEVKHAWGAKLRYCIQLSLFRPASPGAGETLEDVYPS